MGILVRLVALGIGAYAGFHPEGICSEYLLSLLFGALLLVSLVRPAWVFRGAHPWVQRGLTLFFSALTLYGLYASYAVAHYRHILRNLQPAYVASVQLDGVLWEGPQRDAFLVGLAGIKSRMQRRGPQSERAGRVVIETRTGRKLNLRVVRREALIYTEDSIGTGGFLGTCREAEQPMSAALAARASKDW